MLYILTSVKASYRVFLWKEHFPNTRLHNYFSCDKFPCNKKHDMFISPTIITLPTPHPNDQSMILFIMFWPDWILFSLCLILFYVFPLTLINSLLLVGS